MPLNIAELQNIVWETRRDRSDGPSPLERDRHTHSSTHAECGDPATEVEVFHEMQQRDDDARAAAADRMAKRDSAAALIEFSQIERELTRTPEHLDRKRFVDLHGIDLIEPPARFGAKL
jgi:hypothetical protein